MRLPSTQKFHLGDLVHVAREQGSSRSHFDADVDALVIGSYSDVCAVHGENDKDYALIILPSNDIPYFTAWYPEHTLRLIKKRTLESIARTEALNRREVDPG